MALDVQFDSLLGCKDAKWSLKFGKWAFLRRYPLQASWCCWKLTEQSLGFPWSHITQLRKLCELFLWKYVIPLVGYCTEISRLFRLKADEMLDEKGLKRSGTEKLGRAWCFVPDSSSSHVLSVHQGRVSSEHVIFLNFFFVLVKLGSFLCWCTISASWEHTQIGTH